MASIHDSLHPIAQRRAEFLELLVGAVLGKLLQRRHTRRHRQRIARQRPRLINRPTRRQQLHDIRATAKCADRQPAADNLAERRQVSADAVQFLRPTARHAKPADHFIKNQQRPVVLRQFAQLL